MLKSILIQNYNDDKSFCLTFKPEDCHNVHDLKLQIEHNKKIKSKDQVLISHGKILQDNLPLNEIPNISSIKLLLRLDGGKGGFGSLLRGQAATKRKITNFDDSRDLQGRRIKNVNNHKKLLEWLKNKKEEDERIKKELEDFKEMQKNMSLNYKDPRLSQEFKEKLDKWNEELASSIRSGVKKQSSQVKNGKNKVETNDKIPDFQFKEKSNLNETNGLKKTVENSEIDEFRVPRKKLPLGVKKNGQSGLNDIKKDQAIKERIANLLNNDDNNEKRLADTRAEENDHKSIMFENKQNLSDPKESLDNKNHLNDKAMDSNTTQSAIESIPAVNSNTSTNGFTNIIPTKNEKSLTENRKLNHEYEEIDLKKVNSIEDLIKLGPDHIKAELMRLGLKCGGTPMERAKRLYDIKLNPALLFDNRYIAKKK